MTMCEFSSPQIPITDIENAMERIGSPVRELRRLDAGDDSEVLLCNGLFGIQTAICARDTAKRICSILLSQTV